MSEVFADSFYWLALLNRRDQFHSEVMKCRLDKPVVTSAAVLLEVMDALCLQQWRSIAFRFWNRIATSGNPILVPFSESLLERAVVLFGQRLDKDWSLTDCISFVLMQDRGIHEVLTADHHFEQAGFRILFH
jgi:predicted nucleic acid-binding protein